MPNVPSIVEAAPMERAIRAARSNSEGAWSFARRAKLIRENLVGAVPEKTEPGEKPSRPPSGVVEALEESNHGTTAAFNALSEELSRIEACLGVAT